MKKISDDIHEFVGRPFDDQTALQLLNIKDWHIEYTIEDNKIIITSAIQKEWK